MEYFKIIQLKNGKSCVLRHCTEADAQEVGELFNLTHAQTDFLLTYPDENSFSIQQEEEFLRNKHKSKREIEICAVIDGKIVGTAGNNCLADKDKVRHRARFGISVDQRYWGLGIGKALTVACIECAKAADYILLELNVVRENHAAIALYSSVGFIEYGCIPKGFKSRTGWQELVYMYKEL